MFESLESRCLMCAMGLGAGGQLNINCGALNDTVLFAPSPAGGLLVNDSGVITAFAPGVVTSVVVKANGGNDVVDAGTALATPMTFYGGPGHDSLSGGMGADLILGEAGDDVLIGRAGNDRIYGGIGNDTLSGDAGMDWLYGEDGNDQLFSNDGAIDGIVDGGAGVDVAVNDLFDPVINVP